MVSLCKAHRCARDSNHVLATISMRRYGNVQHHLFITASPCHGNTEDKDRERKGETEKTESMNNVYNSEVKR